MSCCLGIYTLRTTNYYPSGTWRIFSHLRKFVLVPVILTACPLNARAMHSQNPQSLGRNFSKGKGAL
ncbi:hypothetical protein An04g01510 [Aspergillus niger]|uniref:Uncharacterized protein n=2 Tax=Aspergillus niger TaxID=5061 RepID=A5AAK3_ASPNC|nr:hypothetical protein An04g01510 [Aspergillus niger]CAK47913.1 hypothetical protein An04g01510 [Aspergillus niger]